MVAPGNERVSLSSTVEYPSSRTLPLAYPTALGNGLFDHLSSMSIRSNGTRAGWNEITPLIHDTLS